MATSLAPPGNDGLDHLMDARALVMALQAVYSALTPLLRSHTRALLVLEPLAACLSALQILSPQALLTIRRAPRLLACVGFQLLTLASEWGLDRLAEYAAGIDVVTFAAAVDAEAQGVDEPTAASAAAAKDADADEFRGRF